MKICLLRDRITVVDCQTLGIREFDCFQLILLRNILVSFYINSLCYGNLDFDSSRVPVPPPNEEVQVRPHYQQEISTKNKVIGYAPLQTIFINRET
jgi:hypothetical protein